MLQLTLYTPYMHIAALDQWERELQLYCALKRLRVFRQYKLWKAFRLWRKAVSSAKFARAKTALQKDLFLLSPVFQGAMRRCAVLWCDVLFCGAMCCVVLCCGEAGMEARRGWVRVRWGVQSRG
jgi:hypothetical protein